MEEKKSIFTDIHSIFHHYQQLKSGFVLNDIFKSIFPLKKLKIEESSLHQSHFSNRLKENEILQKVNLHVFDVQYYKRTKLFDQISKFEIQHHFVDTTNKGLFFTSPENETNSFPFFISNHVSDKSVFSNHEKAFAIPLYLYPDPTFQQHLGLINERIPNFSKEFIAEIELKLEIPFKNEYPVYYKPKNNQQLTFFTPNELFEYFIGVFLMFYWIKRNEKHNFEYGFEIKLPESMFFFNDLREIGRKCMLLFLLDSTIISSYVSQFPEDGNNLVSEIRIENFEDEELQDFIKIFINEKQYFSLVPKTVWDFQFSNYKPLQVWLQTRLSKTLTFDEIIYFHKMVKAVSELGNI